MKLDNSNDNEFAKSIYATVLALIQGNKNFHYTKFSNEDAEDFTQEIIAFKLLKIRQRLKEETAIRYFRVVVRNFVIDKINKLRGDDGIIAVLSELSDNMSEKADNVEFDTGISLGNKSIRPKPIQESNLYKYLSSAKHNKLFQNLQKWMLWYNKSTVYNDTLLIVPKTDLSRIGFTTLEPSGYNVYINPSTLIAKYDLWLNHNLIDRDYMWWAIKEMTESKQEEDAGRNKKDPMVGAVLVDGEGRVVASSHRGKYEPKGHAEYNLLECDVRKEKPEIIKRSYKVEEGKPGAGADVTELDLKDAVLFVTLEPCADRNTGKCSCADRVIYSGIKTVFIGLKDPDKTVDGNGIKKMKEAGITVKYFHQDLLFEIIRAKNTKGEQQNLEFILSKKEFYLKEQPELFIDDILNF